MILHPELIYLCPTHFTKTESMCPSPDKCDSRATQWHILKKNRSLCSCYASPRDPWPRRRAVVPRTRLQVTTRPRSPAACPSDHPLELLRPAAACPSVNGASRRLAAPRPAPLSRARASRQHRRQITARPRSPAACPSGHRPSGGLASPPRRNTNLKSTVP